MYRAKLSVNKAATLSHSFFYAPELTCIYSRISGYEYKSSPNYGAGKVRKCTDPNTSLGRKSCVI